MRKLWQHLASQPALLLLLLLVPSLTGCRSFSVNTRSTADFHRSALATQGVMVGGITALGGGEYALADQISLRFVEAMARIAPTGAVVSLPMVQERMGVTRHRELEKRFSEEETLRPADLKVFSDLPGRSRYLLWVDARGNSSLNSHTYQVGRRQRYQDPISGVVWWGEPHLMQETFLTITDLSTTFVIWDLRTGETVWTCRISGTESLRERMTRPSGDARVDAAAGAHGTFEQMVERAVAALPP